MTGWRFSAAAGWVACPGGWGRNGRIMDRKPRLLLVNPALHNELQDRSGGLLQPIGLAYLAAYSPPDWVVRIHDEQLQGPAPMDADLVGITATTWSVNRAYALAGEYRKKGIPVVLGGVHPSMLPDEAGAYADAVVVGDAEQIWADVVADAARGELQPVYRPATPALEGLRQPRRDLLTARYMFTSISTVRGCPYRCEFCAIDRFYGGKVRRRPLDEVVEELRTLDERPVYFVDGNLYGHSRRDRRDFIELCRRIADDQREGRLRFDGWVCYAPVDALADDEALDAARDAGCRVMRVGFESINAESLAEMRKRQNVRMGAERYKDLIANAHRHGLSVTGEFLIGADGDTPESLRETREFILSSGLDLMRLNILQPMPGTDLLERWQTDGRLTIDDFPADWDRLQADAFLSVVYRPKHFTARELQEFARETGRAFYGFRSIARRTATGAARMRSLTGTVAMAAVNVKSRGLYYDFEAHGSSRIGGEIRRRLLRALRA